MDGLGVGTVFKSGLGSKSLTTLSSFDGGLTGVNPFGGLLQATSGMLYGTTSGDASTNGTIYSLDAGLSAFVALVIRNGAAGSTLQILGQGLTGTTSVTFNGTTATFTVVSDTFMTAVVPVGATTGPVVVTMPSGPLTSNVAFQVTK